MDGSIPITRTCVDQGARPSQVSQPRWMDGVYKVMAPKLYSVIRSLLQIDLSIDFWCNWTDSLKCRSHPAGSLPLICVRLTLCERRGHLSPSGFHTCTRCETLKPRKLSDLDAKRWDIPRRPSDLDDAGACRGVETVAGGEERKINWSDSLKLGYLGLEVCGGEWLKRGSSLY
jgi:hypothetical protein